MLYKCRKYYETREAKYYLRQPGGNAGRPWLIDIGVPRLPCAGKNAVTFDLSNAVISIGLDAILYCFPRSLSRSEGLNPKGSCQR
jgi:hypothetical protein